MYMLWRLSVCMYMYVHVCLHVGNVCMYNHACMYVCMYVCILMDVCMYICMYVCMYVCIIMYVCMYVYLCSLCMWCMYVCIYIIMYVCIICNCIYRYLGRYVGRWVGTHTLPRLERKRLYTKKSHKEKDYNWCLDYSLLPGDAGRERPHPTRPYDQHKHVGRATGYGIQGVQVDNQTAGPKKSR